MSSSAQSSIFHYLIARSMTTLTPREPYSPEELEQLYPKGLKLQLVQVVSPEPHPSTRQPELIRPVPPSW